MARAKDLAALAGLAGLAYAMRNKDKSNEDAGDQKTSSYTKDTKKVEAKDEPFKATHGSSYTPGNAGTARLGVGNATNDPIVKPAPAAKPVLKPAAAADEPAGFATPVSSANRTDQLANLSRAVKREAKTKQFADDVPYQESAQKTDALAVASRAARAADARRRAAKQSSYKSGGMTSSASSRADGIASRGKTRGKIC